MKAFAAAFAVLLLATSVCAQAPCPAPTRSGAIASTQWHYEVSLADPRHQLLRIKMAIAPTSPELKVQMPVWNATYQVRDFAEHVNWLRATDASGKAVEVRKLDKTTWSAPNAATVEYEIAAVDSGPFGAELSPDHAFLNLAQVLIYPLNVPKQLVLLKVSNVPLGWHVATPLNAQSSYDFCAASYDQLVDSPVEAGSFKHLVIEQGGARYNVMVHADPDDYDAEFLKSSLSKITAAEVDWMQDRPFDRYMFIYHFPRGQGRGGMEHAYGTAIEMSATRLNQDPVSFLSVSAHEFFHLWNVKRIRPQTLEPIDYTKENYTRALWFSEGVTSSVAEYMLVRSGLVDERVFLHRLAQQIRELQVRPAHKAQSVEESSLDAWLEKYPYYRSDERSISYYDKGQIVGVMLDLEMRRVSGGKKSLRELFQYMNQQYAKQGKYFDDSEGIRAAAEAVTGAKLGDFFHRYVSGTDEIPYNDFFQTVGLSLVSKPVTSADAGFTASTNFGPSPVIMSVTPGGEAEKAQLHAGDSIVAVNGGEPEANFAAQIAQMDPGSTVKLKVSSRNRTREVKLKLTSKQDVEYSFAELPNATAEQRARRAAWMRGDSETGGMAH
jgi:predicted metalloprotease with PDZ domain